MNEKRKFNYVDVLDQNGKPCTIVLQEYKNLEVVSSYDSEGNHYSSYATPKTPTTLRNVTITVKSFITANEELKGIDSVNLVMGYKVLNVDKQTPDNVLAYQYTHYDELYETAPEHLK